MKLKTSLLDWTSFKYRWKFRRYFFRRESLSAEVLTGARSGKLSVGSWDGQIGYARVQKNLVRTPRTSCTRLYALYAVWNFGLYHSLYGFLSSLITNLIIISRLKRAYTICPSQVGSPWLELRELEIWLKIPSGLHNFQRLISDKNAASISTIRKYFV